MPRRGSRFLAGRASNPLAARFREIERAIRRRQRFNTSEVTTIVNNAISGGGGGGGGSPANTLIVDDEGVQQGTAERMDFVGGGVTASVVGNTATIDVPCPCDCDEQLVLDGGFWMSPDAAAFDITGDLDLRAAIAADDYTPASFDRVIVNKWTQAVGNRSYLLSLTTTGELALTWSTDGTDVPFAVSTASLSGLAGGEAVAVRVTLDVNNGAAGKTVTFYTKAVASPTALSTITSDTGWTILGTAVTTAGTTSIFSGNAALGVGGRVGGPSANHFAGSIYAAVVKDGIDGTAVANPDFAAQPAGTDSFSDALSNPWTLEEQSAIPVGCLGETAVYDEGVFQGTVKEFDFVGSSVSAATSGDRATVTVGGAGYRLVSRAEIAQGTTTYNVPAGIDALLVECIGAGGGGGGAGTAAVSAAAGVGGGGGGYAQVLLESLAASYTVQVGAGGAGGAAGTNNGSAGTDTTFDSPSVCTATGGAGGGGGAAGTVPAITGGADAGVGTVGSVLLGGQCSVAATVLSGTVAASSAGGMAARGGGGGRGRAAQNAGGNGRIYGGGGGGGCVLNGGAAVAGGNGANGRIIVWEYASA